MKKILRLLISFRPMVIILFAILSRMTSAQDYGLGFNGTNQYVTTTLDAQPSVMSSTTWEAWIKPARINYSVHQAILSTDDGGWDRGIWINPNTNQFVIGCGNAGGWTPPATINANEWYHIAVVYTPTNVLFYLNGTEYSLGAAPSGQSTLAKLSIGASQYSSQYFQGTIDEVRVWNVARSQSQITSTMNTELSGSESDLITYYRMNEGSGSNITDNSGHSYTAILNNSPAWTAGAMLGTYLSGAQDYGLGFRGTNQFVDCGNVVVTGANPRTVEAWVYTCAFNFGGPWQMGAQSTHNEFSIRTWDTDNNWLIQIWGDDISVNLPGSKNAWSHLAMVYDGTNIKLYYNGNLVVNQARTLNTLTQNFCIGKWGSGYFYGMIDEVRIWDVARTQDQIRSTMNTQLSGSESNLVAYYKMNEGGGTTITDNSAHSHNGNLNNSPSWVAGAYQPAGTGASGDEYQIATLNNLYWLTQEFMSWDKYFKQTADIDASYTRYWENGAGWLPIGRYMDVGHNSFAGSYNGQNYIISGLYINRFGTDYQGLFGFLSHSSTTQAIIQRINLRDVNISGGRYVGAIAGYVDPRTTIEYCSSAGIVNGVHCTGGLLGYLDDQILTSIYVTFSYSACNINATGNNIGGLIGDVNRSPTIRDCYAIGNINGYGVIGGLVGFYDPSAYIRRCFSAGHVSGTEYLGGLVGYVWAGPFTQNSSLFYYDNQTTGQSYPIGNDNWTTLGRRSTAEMKTQSNYFDYDFSTIWARDDNKNGGYPYLQWQTFPYTITFTDGSDVTLSPAAGQVNQPIGRFALKANSTGASFEAVWIKLNGSRSGLSDFKLWESNDNTFNSASDTQIGLTYNCDPGTGSNIWFIGLNSRLLTTDKYYFLTCNLASDATCSIAPIITCNRDLLLGFGTLGTSISNLPLTRFKPTVTTQAVSNIFPDRAIGHGTITDLGCPSSAQYGLCWSTSANPTTADNFTQSGPKSETGAFSLNITGLSLNTTYYVRAYATNVAGTSYGEQVQFTTSFGSGNAVLFNRNNSNYISATPAVPQSGPYTLEAWIKPNLMGSEGFQGSPQIRPGIVGWGEYAVADAVNAFRITTDGLANYWWNTGDLTVTTGSFTGQWHHVAATYDGTTKSIYLDGNLAGSASPSVSYNTRGNSYFAIGRTNYGVGTGVPEYFDGYIDEVRIYNICKSRADIRHDMHLTLSGTETGLVSIWNFNEGTGTSASNSCGSGDGTLRNFLMNGTDGWVTSTAPIGPGTCASATSFTSGTSALGNVTLTMTNAFDSAVDLFCIQIPGAPTRLPTGLTSVAGNRYFILEAYGTLGTFAANLTFTFGPGIIDSRADAFPGGIKLFRRNSNSDGDWTLAGSAVSANSATGVVTFNNITSFSQFAIGQDEAALPVELVSFIAETGCNKVTLKWTTATEVNNYGFEVERVRGCESVRVSGRLGDGETGRRGEWEKIGFIKGAGNSNSPKEYSFVDNSVFYGEYSYRLKQLDNDGSFKYGDEIKVQAGTKPSAFSLSNYPNPFNPLTTVRLELPEKGKIDVSIYNILGEKVMTIFSGELEAGVYEDSFNGSSLASGMYIMTLRTNKDALIVKKIMLVK